MTTQTQIPDLFSRIESCAQFIQSWLQIATASQPTIALVLGSGLGGVTSLLQKSREIAYRDIPHMPASRVEGHRGRLLHGTFGNVPLLIFEGRVHGYEGHAPGETTFAIRVMAALQIKSLIVTNAAGAIRETLCPGDLVAITDHINLTGTNPAAGPHDPRLGPQFFDMTDAYSPRLRDLAIGTAAALGWQLPHGVYLGVQGPSFETPAEIRAFRAMGADLVGMSTVHEVIIARQCALAVLGISCVTNLAAGVLDQPLTHGEVMTTAAAASDRLGKLLVALLPQI